MKDKGWPGCKLARASAAAVLVLWAVAAQAVGTGPSPATRQNVGNNQAADTVVICPTEFRQALRPWVEYRTAEGHRLALLSNLGSTDQLRRQIADGRPGRAAAVRGPGGR